MGHTGIDPPFWSQDASTLAAAMGSGPDGLSSIQAAATLAEVGPNSVADAPRLRISPAAPPPLVLILAFAAVISLALQQWMNVAIILAIVLGNSLLSFFQEYRAPTADEELKKRLALNCRLDCGQRLT